MKKDKFIIGFIIVLVLIIGSCSSRKTETEKKQEVTKQEISGIFRNSGNSDKIENSVSTITTSSLTTINDQIQKTTTKKVFRPLNPRLPASFTDESGKKFDLNNSSYTEETTTEKNNFKSENSRNSEELQKKLQHKKSDFKKDSSIKAADKKNITDNNKKTDNGQWSYWNVLWLLIPVIIWKVYKKINPIL